MPVPLRVINRPHIVYDSKAKLKNCPFKFAKLQSQLGPPSVYKHGGTAVGACNSEYGPSSAYKTWWHCCGGT